MKMKNKVSVTGESRTGRNIGFRDERTHEKITRMQFVREIEHGNYPDYHVRVISGFKTLASDPDKSRKNNLG